MKKITSKSKEETQELAGEILCNLRNRNVILLRGKLGAGKTTFAQGFLKVSGAKGPFTSPTFVIMKRYVLESNFKTRNFKEIYHIDAYRIEAEDMLELGWEEIINNPENLVLIEWPEKIKSILPKKYLQLKLEILEDKKREIEITRI